MTPTPKLIESKILKLLLKPLTKVVRVWGEDVKVTVLKADHKVSLIFAHCQTSNRSTELLDVVLCTLAIDHGLEPFPCTVVGELKIMDPSPDHLFPPSVEMCIRHGRSSLHLTIGATGQQNRAIFTE